MVGEAASHEAAMPAWLARAHEFRAATTWTARDLALLGLPGLPTTEFRMREWLLRHVGPGTATRGRGRGGVTMAWHRLALPAALRQAITRHIDGEMLRLGLVTPALPSPATTREARQADRLPPNLAMRAAARAEILGAWRSWRDASGQHGWRGRQAFAALYATGQIPTSAETIRLVPQLCAASLAAWERREEQAGFVALAGAYKPRESALETEPALAIAAEGAIAAYPRLSAGHLRDILRVQCKQVALPSLRSIQRWLAAWKARNKRLHAHLDNPDRAKSHLRAAFGNAAAGAINARWEIDATPADLILADGRRHTLLGLIDVGTRRLRLLVAEHSSGVGVGLLLRRCLLEWGIPGQVATDNGAEFTGQHIRRVLSDLQIAHDIAPPFSPESKPFIERAFRTFAHDLVELMPGYVGHTVAERAAIRARRSFAERLCGRAARAEVELAVSAAELQAFCDAWARERYERRPHTGLRGKSPFEAAQAQARAVLKIADERALDVLLAPACAGGWRVVGKKGLRLENGLFVSPELALLIGERVECRADPADAGRIYVFKENGRFACIAVDPERTGIDRRELAVAARRLAAADLAEQRKRMREARARIDPRSLVRAILEADAAEAAKVVALPQAPEMFSTPALEQAGLAARAEDAPVPPPRGPEDDARARHVVDLEARRAARQAHDDRAEAAARIRRGLKCREALLAGLTLGADELAWFRAYENSSEFRTVLADRFGIDIRPGRYRPLAPPAAPQAAQPQP